MAPVTMTYTAVCEREGDWWVVTVPELESGGVTQAHTLDEVSASVADLVALMTDTDSAGMSGIATTIDAEASRADQEAMAEQLLTDPYTD
jgi:predicted RNase H-like HicB family nuclease